MKKISFAIRLFALCICIFSLLCVNLALPVKGAEVENPEETENVQSEESTEDVSEEETEDVQADESQENASEAEDSAVAETKERISSKSAIDSKVAYVEMESYTVEGGILKASNNINVKLTLHNISKSVAADSVVMTMSSNSQMLYPSYGNDNQIFVGKILPNERVEVSVPISVSPQFSGDAVDLRCDFRYLSDTNVIDSSSTMIITTAAGKSLIVKSIDISSHAVLNGKSLLSIKYSNNSNLNIDDAQLEISGNVSADSKTIKLDNVFAGKTYTKDFNVTFTSSGDQEINVKLVYTDASGEKTETDLGKYSVSVVKGTVIEESDTIVDYALYYGGRLVSVIIVIIALVICLKYSKARLFD